MYQKSHSLVLLLCATTVVYSSLVKADRYPNQQLNQAQGVQGWPQHQQSIDFERLKNQFDDRWQQRLIRYDDRSKLRSSQFSLQRKNGSSAAWASSYGRGGHARTGGYVSPDGQRSYSYSSSSSYK